jgi:hypothetical protein
VILCLGGGNVSVSVSSSYTKPVIIVLCPGLGLPHNSLLRFQPLVHSPVTPANLCHRKACILNVLRITAV